MPSLEMTDPAGLEPCLMWKLWTQATLRRSLGAKNTREGRLEPCRMRKSWTRARLEPCRKRVGEAPRGLEVVPRLAWLGEAAAEVDDVVGAHAEKTRHRGAVRARESPGASSIANLAAFAARRPNGGAPPGTWGVSVLECRKCHQTMRTAAVIIRREVVHPDPGAAVGPLGPGLRRHRRARPALDRGHGPGARRTRAAGLLGRHRPAVAGGSRGPWSEVVDGSVALAAAAPRGVRQRGFALDVRREGAEDRARPGS
jgi:hypothetical protein